MNAPIEIYRTPPCPLHFGVGYSLECIDCRAMPTIMPDGSLRDSMRAATTNELRRWAETYQRERGLNANK
jgi:hypothetical protein